MPRKGKRKRTYGKKKNTKFRRSKRRTKRTVGYLPGILPDAIKVKLKYNANFTMSDATVSILDQFRGNSPFDPDYTGGGAQPTFYDQWSALYDKYTVSRSTIRVEAINMSATVPVEMDVWPSNGTAIVGDASEQPRCRTAILPPLTGSGSKKTIKNAGSVKAIMGEKFLDPSQYEATTDSNPTKVQFWNVNASSLDGIGLVNVQYRMFLTFYVTFSQRKMIAES